ncbi:P-loop NTPase family protein [Kiloniella spongiae]|uniref:hypothetical protein n=1 Tax=Kiloniella spongiae TaxID=1489064 RepID=UPI00069B8DC0|nr:hypothetical protein [Kiloniella spongiae]
MRKIHITGNAGAGKTTLAKEIGTALGLPVFGLDKIVWQPGWKKCPRDVRIKKELELSSKPEWVIDGVSEKIREAADIIIFLDVKRSTAFFRCAKRNWRYLFKSRPELPVNCPEILIIPCLLKIIWQFQDHVRPDILKSISQRPSSSYIIEQSNDLLPLFQKLGISNLYNQSKG